MHAKTRFSSASDRPAAAAWGTLLPAALIVVGAVLAYCNTFSVPFLLDDVNSVSDNPTIRRLWPPRFALSPPRDGSPVDGRPVLNYSFAVNHALSGREVWSYHAGNLLIHILTALILLGVLRRTFVLPGMPEWMAKNAVELAGSIALLWTLHPLQTESVTYISQRAESLVSLFYLLTLYCFVRGTGAARPAVWYSAAVIVCAVGIASKEVMASAPLIALLYDRTFAAGSFREAFKRRWGLYLGLAATWLPLAALVIGSGGRGGTVGFRSGVSPWHYALTQCDAIVRYLRLSFWPSSLCMDHGDAVVRNLLAVLPQAVAVVALVAMTLWALWRRPAAGFLGAFFLAVLAPTSSVVPVATQTIAEHRMYLPLAAVLTAAVIGACLAGRRLFAHVPEMTTRTMGVALVGLIAVALGATTFLRNEDYRDEWSITTDTVRKRPDNSRAHNTLGYLLACSGKTEAAVAQYRRALELQPDYWQAEHSLGVALIALGRNDEAVPRLRRALTFAPNDPAVHHALGRALERQGEIDAAVAHYRRALDFDPDDAEVHHDLGFALLRLAKVDDAVARFERALELRPNHYQAHNNLGAALARRGEADAAMAHYRQALKLNPDYVDARCNLGIALAERGDFEEAIEHLQAAVAIQPGNVAAVQNLRRAWRERAVRKKKDGSSKTEPTPSRQPLRDEPGGQGVGVNPLRP